jgi:uncharacterized membrane protein YciS (DUF1049 family)
MASEHDIGVEATAAVSGIFTLSRLVPILLHVGTIIGSVLAIAVGLLYVKQDSLLVRA